MHPEAINRSCCDATCKFLGLQSVAAAVAGGVSCSPTRGALSSQPSGYGQELADVLPAAQPRALPRDESGP
jgi:hypothetical protein